MCTAWNGRIADAQQGEGGESLYYCWECGHLLPGLCVLHSPKVPRMQNWHSFTSLGQVSPKTMCGLPNYISYGPINQQAVALLESEGGADRIATSPPLRRQW